MGPGEISNSASDLKISHNVVSNVSYRQRQIRYDFHYVFMLYRFQDMARHWFKIIRIFRTSPVRNAPVEVNRPSEFLKDIWCQKCDDTSNVFTLSTNVTDG